VTARPEVPSALSETAQTLFATRGQAARLRRAFDRSLIPMLVVDNERRYTEVNAAARLLFRMTLQELRGHRIDDLTAEQDLPLLEDGCDELFDRGNVRDRCTLAFKDGSTLWIYFAAIANALPGQHLIVFVPADWPGDELDELRPSLEGGVRGTLSSRQLEVLSLVAVGANAAQIATELSISEATVRTHVKNILERLGAHNRAHAVAIAMADGLLGDTVVPESA
jgi:PAS domain S-box-containing protein